MKQVVLISELNSSNLGDVVISCLSKQVFQNKASQILQFDISTSRLLLVSRIINKLLLGKLFKSLYRKYLIFVTEFELNKILTNETIIVFSGGQMFLDYFAPSIIGVLRGAIKRNIPVHFFACGIGKMTTQNINELTALLTKCDVKITLRDGLSHFRGNILTNVEFCPDIAIKSSCYYGTKNTISNNVGFGCIDIFYYNQNSPQKIITESEYVNSCIHAVSEILKLGYTVTLFTNGSQTDFNVCNKIYKRLCDNKNVRIAPRPKTDVELVEIIKNFSFVVASRLHALIISYSYKIPFLGFAWDDKLYSFERVIGFSSGKIIKKIYEMNVVCWENVFKEINEEEFFAKFEELNSIINKNKETILKKIL